MCPKSLTDTEAIKIYFLPEKSGQRYNVDPPASLASKIKKLPFYKDRYKAPSGFKLRTEGELLLWIEAVAKLKRTEGKQTNS